MSLGIKEEAFITFHCPLGQKERQPQGKHDNCPGSRLNTRQSSHRGHWAPLLEITPSSVLSCLLRSG